MMPNLALDMLEVAAQLGDVIQHIRTMCLEHPDAFWDVGLILAHQLGKFTHFADRHSGLPQAGQNPDPPQIAFGVTAVAALGSDGSQQTLAFVVVQRVHAHASLIGGIPNRKFAGRKLAHAHSVKPGAHSRSRGVTQIKHVFAGFINPGHDSTIRR